MEIINNSTNKKADTYKLNMFIDLSTIQKVKEIAKLEGRSLASQIRYILREYTEKK